MSDPIHDRASHEQTTDDPSAAAARAMFMMGVDHLGRHVVPAAEALLAVAANVRPPLAGAACGARVVVATRWGEYYRAHPMATSAPERLCATCSWTAALATGRICDELDAQVLDALTSHLLERDGYDAQLLVRLCTAILRSDGYTDAALHTPLQLSALLPSGDWADSEPDGRLVQLLAQAAAHRPVALVSEDCAEGDCRHDLDPGNPEICSASVLACPACSLQAGSWAKEQEGQYQPECTIAGPCAVLRALTHSFNTPWQAS